jgi:predicted Zn-dependent peptidase
MRANIALLQHRRDNEILPGLKSLKQLYYSMKHSTSFNPKAYESKMLFNQIKNHEEDLELTKEMLEHLRKKLKTYIDEKDKRYKQLRERRNNS